MEEVMTIPMQVGSTPEVSMDVDMAINVVSGAVNSVNGQTGDVYLTASDVDALPSSTEIPTKTSDLDNDSGFITSVPVQSVNSKTGAVVLDASDVGAIAQETDPTVPSWAKQPSKPTYTASEVGALPDTYTAPVSSVNGQTGAVVIGNATTTTAGLMSAQDKTDLGTLMDDYSSALTALGVI